MEVYRESEHAASHRWSQQLSSPTQGSHYHLILGTLSPSFATLDMQVCTYARLTVMGLVRVTCPFHPVNGGVLFHCRCEAMIS